MAFVLAKVLKVKIREYPLYLNREWRDWQPANPFRFPWNEPLTARRVYQD